MAINQRPDTPLAPTPDAVDPKITRTQSTNPDTGAVTYRQSWSNSSSSKSSTSARKSTPSPRKPSRGSAEPTVSARRTSSKTVTPQSREITSVPALKSVGIKKEEIKAPLMKAQEKKPVRTTTQIREERKTNIYDRLHKQGETREQYDVRNKAEQQTANENSYKNRAREKKGSFLNQDKNRSTSCKNC